MLDIRIYLILQLIKGAEFPFGTDKFPQLNGEAFSVETARKAVNISLSKRCTAVADRRLYADIGHSGEAFSVYESR